MSTRFDLVTLDSPDTGRLAHFWSAVLDLHEVEREDGDRWIVLADADGRRCIGLQRGATRQGSVHLDVACAPGAFEDELNRLSRARGGLAQQATPRAIRGNRQPR